MSNLPEPHDREEIMLKAIASSETIQCPTPRSRKEIYLKEIYENGGGGGGGGTTSSGQVYSAILDEEASSTSKSVYNVTVEGLTELTEGTCLNVLLNTTPTTVLCQLNVNGLGVYNVGVGNNMGNVPLVNKTIYMLRYSKLIQSKGAWHCLNTMPAFSQNGGCMGILRYTDESRLKPSGSKGVVDSVEATSFYNGPLGGVLKATYAEGAYAPVGIDVDGNIVKFDKLFSASSNGLAPKATVEERTKFLKGDGKWDLPDAYTKAETDSLISAEIAKIIADAPASFDTLKEIADWITNDTTGAAKMANDISNLVTTKYEKPSTGIPAIDLSADVQTNLEKAASALQSETYKGTVTGIKMNGVTVSEDANGVVNLGAVLTEHQDISGKADSIHYDKDNSQLQLKSGETVLSTAIIESSSTSITYGTTDLEEGVSELADGAIYICIGG